MVIVLSAFLFGDREDDSVGVARPAGGLLSCHNERQLIKLGVGSADSTAAHVNQLLNRGANTSMFFSPGMYLPQYLSALKPF